MKNKGIGNPICRDDNTTGNPDSDWDSVWVRRWLNQEWGGKGDHCPTKIFQTMYYIQNKKIYMPLYGSDFSPNSAIFLSLLGSILAAIFDYLKIKYKKCPALIKNELNVKGPKKIMP